MGFQKVIVEIKLSAERRDEKIFSSLQTMKV